MTETDLEAMSNQIDEILERHNLNGRVRGGYIADTNILFTFSDNTYPGQVVCAEIKQALNVRQVIGAPGALVVQQ
jgi:hypothetical protein